MKKILLIMPFIMITLLVLTGCNNSIRSFKEDYESLNGKTSASGKEHRTVTIPENNPFVFSSAKEIIKKIENNETFYVYFGSKLCPWCRSVIEKAIEVANDNSIKKIYYVDIWDDEGKEILRDKYVIGQSGIAEKTNEGTTEYFKLLEYFDTLLPEYKFAANKNGGDELNIDEKRIYAPTFIYVDSGVPIKITDGLSDKQTSSREELTKEILMDEELKFNDFFVEYCDLDATC